MRSHVLATIAVVATSMALVGCATLQRTVEVQSDLDSLTKSGAVGSIATLDDNSTTTVLTSGVPHQTNGDSIGPRYRVRIAGVTKTFTAALVLQLVAQDKVGLDAPVQRYLPGLVPGDTITVRHLLQHRSGLAEFAGEPNADEWVAANENRTLTPADAVAIALSKPAQFEPGSAFRYTNTNYIVLGMLVEAVTGRSYADELRTRILEPLELEDTYLPPPGERDIRGEHMTGYADLPGGRTDVSRIEPSIPWSAGALVSTGKDLNTFWRALLSGRIVDRKSVV